MLAEAAIAALFALTLAAPPPMLADAAAAALFALGAPPPMLAPAAATVRPLAHTPLGAQNGEVRPFGCRPVPLALPVTF